jgi:hypothetical protein
MAISGGDYRVTKQDSVVAVHLEQQMQDRLIEHKHCIDKQGQDTPAIRILKRMEPIGSNAGQKSFEAIEKDREPMHESQPLQLHSPGTYPHPGALRTARTH